MELSSLIIPLISGLAGFMGGLVATYVKWDVEKRKLKVENRKERIREWRLMIERADIFEHLWGTSVITELKPYLAEEDLKTLYIPVANKGGGGSGDDVKKQLLFKAILDVEKSWELI